jgi:hypothetical protein
MNLQIAKTPKQVGLPVDMIKMTPKETEWIRRKKSTPIELPAITESPNKNNSTSGVIRKFQTGANLLRK